MEERQREQIEATTQELPKLRPGERTAARRTLGDYSVAVADGENIFIATEYSSGGPRDIFVNWATSMSEINTAK